MLCRHWSKGISGTQARHRHGFQRALHAATTEAEVEWEPLAKGTNGCIKAVGMAQGYLSCQLGTQWAAARRSCIGGHHQGIYVQVGLDPMPSSSEQRCCGGKRKAWSTSRIPWQIWLGLMAPNSLGTTVLEDNIGRNPVAILSMQEGPMAQVSVPSSCQLPSRLQDSWGAFSASEFHWGTH